MGLIQKIFYFHVPAWIVMFLAVAICGVASAVHLFRQKPAADRLAVAAAELAVVFGIIGLATGPLWARKAWGVWWQWDARLTMALILELIFCAYLMLRRYGGPGSDKLAAGLALFGLANVPFVYISVNVWRTIHPTTSVVPQLATSAPRDVRPVRLVQRGVSRAVHRAPGGADPPRGAAGGGRAALSDARGGMTGVTDVQRTAIVITLAAVLLVPAAAGFASHSGQPQPPQEEFVPIDQVPPEDQLPAAPLLIAAYAIVWVVVFGYLWSIWRRLSTVERELTDLSGRAGGGEQGT